jgi:peptide/nickel transport system substrate-binding protein
MKKVILFVSLFVAVAAAFCGLPSGVSAAEKPDTIVIASQQDFSVLDPFNTTATPDMNADWCIYDSLLNMDVNGNYYPLVAESWDVTADGKEYTFHIRKGITFHDGSPLTAKDVVYSAMKMKNSPFKVRVSKLFDSAEAVDDYTMKFILPQPAAPFLYEIAYNFAVYSEAATEAAGEKFKDNPIGCGPYKFVSQKSGEGVVLKAYENYYGGKAPIENIIFKVIPDASTALVSLENGEIDLCQYVASASYPIVVNNPKLGLLQTKYSRVFNLILNTQAEPFKGNAALRQAISHAIDKQFLVDVALEGYGSVAVTLVNDSFIAAPKNIAQHAREYDVDKAKELMAEAGYPDGKGLPTLVISTIEMFKKQSEIIQAQLKEIGINVRIDMLELSTYLSMQANGELQMGLMSTNQGGDAAVFQTLLLKGSTNNGAVYDNPDVERLFIKASAILDNDERSKVYDELYRIVLEDMPYVSIYFPDTISCGRADLDFAKIMDFVAYRGYYYSYK